MSTVIDLGSDAVALISPNHDREITTVYSIGAKRELLRIHLEHRAWLISHGHGVKGAGHLYAARSTSDGVEVGEITEVEAAARSLGVDIPAVTMTLRQVLSAGTRR